MNESMFICDLSKCKLFLEKPILLPCCGSTICKEHENKIDKKGGKYKCPICEKQHQLLEKGFPINKKISVSMKNLEHFRKNQDRILQSLNPELRRMAKQHEPMKAEVIIYDFFAKIRNLIDLHREQMIEKIYQKQMIEKINKQQMAEKIHKKSGEMLDLLKQQEKYNQNAFNLINIELEEIIASKLSEWKKMIRNPEINEHEVNILTKEIEGKIIRIKNEISKYKNDSFMNDQIKFIPSKLFDCFGELKIEKESLNCK